MKKSVLLSALVLFGLALVARAGLSFGHKVQVQDAITAEAIVDQGGRLIADYGSFQVYDVPQLGGNLPATARVRDNYNTIFLNAGHLDTSTAAVQTMRKTAGAFAGRRMHLIHFAGPIQPAWRKALLGAGVQIVSYIPQNAYLVYGNAAGIGRVQALAATAPHVQWDGDYLDDYKIHPRARAVDQNGKPRTDRFAIQMVADAAPNADTLNLINQLQLAPIERQQSVLNYLDVTVRLPAAALARIAARPDVVSIQPSSPPRKVCERQDQIVAGNLSGNTPTGPGYLAWLAGRGFTQAQFSISGFVVDVSDSGIDNGTTTPNHFGLYAGGDVSGTSRVMYNILQGTPNPGSTKEGCDGHGNLNAHIVMGYDDSSGFPFTDSDGYHYGLGTCPFVNVGSSVIFDPINSTNPNDDTVISTAYEHGARISNNSWGDSESNDDGTYDSDSQAYDALVRNAEQGTSTNHEMVIVFAAGNDGPNPTSISPPATAKNVITVGAGANVQPFGGCDGSDVCDSMADNANEVLSFSARGPCDDGRIKPDLIAPGTHISGGAPQENRVSTGNGAALTCFLDISAEDIGVSGGVGTNGQLNRFFPNDQQFYTASSGTSHSTPCVTGGCALVRQYFINSSNNPPSPAMTKAFLMNSARYMTGSGADDALWSDTQGMGEMDLGMAFDGTLRILRDELSGDTFTASGQKRVYTGVVGDSSKPFRVTVAWTDYPGNTSGDAYNNDLDLTVTVGGNTYLGNVFSGPTSATGGSPDEKNNVESVFLPAGVSGPFTVTVTAANINSPAVNDGNGQVNQDFALVIYNTGQAPTIVAAGYTLTNEPCGNTNVYPGETVTLKLALQNVGTFSTTNLVATLLPYLAYRDETVPGEIPPADSGDALAALLATNQTAFPSGPQTYGALASGAIGTNSFTFFADGACGQTINAILQLQDGSANLGTVSYTIPMGPPMSNDCANCSPTNVATPNMIFPTNGYQFASFLPAAVVTGQAPPNSMVELSNNGVLSQTITADDNGVYAALVAMDFGSNALSVADNVTNSLFIELAPPDLQVPPVANTNVGVSGTGAAGAIVSIYNTNTGALLQTFVVNAVGDFAGTVSLPLGGFVLTATETIDGQTSSNTAPYSVSVVPVPPPTIAAPINGVLVNVEKQTITGKGAPGAVLTLYDTTNGGTGVLATTTVTRGGRFSVAAELADGGNALYATQEQNGTNSPPSGLVIVNDYYQAPVILFQPQNQTNFLGGMVTFSAEVGGKTPLRISWYKNGVRIAGAGSEKLTVANIRESSVASYVLTASNADGIATSSLATLSLVYNPFITLGGTYQGLFTEPAPQFDSSGLLSLTMTSLGEFTGKILSAGGTYPFSGGFSGVGWWSNIVSRGADLMPLTVVMDMNVTNGSNQVFGTVSDGTNWTANLELNRAMFSAANPFTNQGRFTLVFGGDSNVDGYGTVSVNASGMTSLRGVLSDNTGVAPAAASISTNGRWPLYIPLYGRFGSLVSWIDFTNAGASITNLTNAGPCSFVGSNAVWFRTNSDGKYYPNGLTNDLTIIGSTFSPEDNALLLDSTNLEAVLSGGDLAGAESNSVSAPASGRFTADGTGIPDLILDLDPGTGILRGSFSDPSLRPPAPIKGVVFQQQTNAAGFFLGATNAGSFLLTSP